MRICDKCHTKHGSYIITLNQHPYVHSWDICLECSGDLKRWFSLDQPEPEVKEPCSDCHKEEGEFYPD